jgi:hypothetical protein
LQGGKGKAKGGEDEESDDEEVPPEVKARLDFLKTLAVSVSSLYTHLQSLV